MSASSTNQRLPKRRRLNDAFQSKVSTHIYLNGDDHKQFIAIFDCVDNSNLIKALNVTHFICKDIAEYATGSFVRCWGKKGCQNKIALLNEHKDSYSYDEAFTFGYKWCKNTNKYFCSECMDDVKQCHCSNYAEFKEYTVLTYMPHCGRCNRCDEALFDCNGHFESCRLDCSNVECSYMQCDFSAGCGADELNFCVGCNELFCTKCSYMPDDWDTELEMGECICNNCAVDTVIQCSRCHIECPLFYQSNDMLCVIRNLKVCSDEECDHFSCEWDRGFKGVISMRKCKDEKCNVYVCVQCGGDGFAMDTQRTSESELGFWDGRHNKRSGYCSKHVPMCANKEN